MTTSSRIGIPLTLVLSLGLTAASAMAQVRQFPLDLSKMVDSTRVPVSDMVLKTPGGAVRKVPRDVSQIMVNPGDYVVVRTGAEPTKVEAPSGAGVAYQLPITMATVGATGTQIALGIIVRTGNGLMPRTDGSRHEGRIFVGIVNTLDPVTPIALTTPIQVTVAGPVESITPDQPKFDSTNMFVPVEVVARNPSDPVELKVSTAREMAETTVPLTVFNASASVVISVPRIAGFGFETADITVQAKGIPNPQGAPVTLFLQGGEGSFVPSSRVELDANGRAMASLRSSGISPAVVVAATLSSGATAQAQPIAYTWPVAWIAFAVGGGLIGGVLRQLTGALKSWLAALVISVLMGFLSAGLYSLGISIIPAIPTGTGGQLVVAVIAALGSLGGVGLLPIPGGSKKP